MKQTVFAVLLLLTAFGQYVSLAAGQPSITLVPVADNYADSKYPQNNYGHVLALYVGNSYDASQKIWGSERIYIRFDLSGLAKGLVILKATLSLWQYHAPASPQEYDAHRVLGDWNETTQNWENQPEWAVVKTSSAIAPARTNATVEWDLTSDVKAWYSGEAPNYGTMVKATLEAHVADASSGFWSRDYIVEEWKPKLTILVQGNPVLTYTIKVTAAGLPAGLAYKISVDGQESGSSLSDEEKEIMFDQGTTHTIEVSSLIPGPEGIRYRCRDNQIHFIGPGSLVFVYRTEYMVTFVAEPAPLFQTPNNGWYQAGATLVVNRTAPDVVEIAPGTRLAFDGWYMNSRRLEEAPVCVPCGEVSSTTISVNAPAIVQGLYRTEYYLNVTSAIGKTRGSGWYTKDSVVTFSVDPATVPGQGILGFLGEKQSFKQWVSSSSLLGIATQPQGSVVMNEPTTIKAEWEEDSSSILSWALLLLVVLVVGVVVLVRARRMHAPGT